MKSCSPSDLWRDRSAVSPVIAVVLMLALTVTMAAVAVPLVLSQTDQVEDQRPDVDLAFAYTEDTDLGDTDSLGAVGSDPDVDADGELRIIVESGESVPASQLNVSGAASSGNLALSDGDFDEDDDISAGEEITVWTQRGETVQLIWHGPGGDESSILGEFTVRPDS